MKDYRFSVNKSLASVTFNKDPNEKKDMLSRDWSHYVILHKLLNFLGTRGFIVSRDPHYQKEYKRLNKDHWYGRKGNLEFKAERYPAGFKIEFFQNINFENSHGGYYDFDKLQKMPYIIKLMWINETNRIATFLLAMGITESTDPEYKFAEDMLKADFVKSWHHPQKTMEEFQLSDLDGQTCKGNYNHTDRDGKVIYNGQIKYFRHWNGRLMRGKVYHNINNMWWVILDSKEYTNIADFNLFDPTAEDYIIRRMVKDRKPKEYLEKLKNIEGLSNKDLLRELKRRGLKAS